MFELFKLLGNKRLFVLLVGLVTFIALMGFTLSPRTTLSWPEKFLKDSVGFVQYVFYKPASYVAGFFKDVANMRTVYDENEELRIAMGHYTRDRLKYNEMDKKLRAWKKILNLPRNNGTDTIMVHELLRLSVPIRIQIAEPLTLISVKMRESSRGWPLPPRKGWSA